MTNDNNSNPFPPAIEMLAQYRERVIESALNKLQEDGRWGWSWCNQSITINKLMAELAVNLRAAGYQVELNTDVMWVKLP